MFFFSLSFPFFYYIFIFIFIFILIIFISLLKNNPFPYFIVAFLPLHCTEIVMEMNQTLFGQYLLHLVYSNFYFVVIAVVVLFILSYIGCTSCNGSCSIPNVCDCEGLHCADRKYFVTHMYQ